MATIRMARRALTIRKKARLDAAMAAAAFMAAAPMNGPSARAACIVVMKGFAARKLRRRLKQHPGEIIEIFARYRPASVV